MTDLYDVAAIGNAIVDVIAPSSEEFISDQGLPKGGMTLIDDARAEELYEAMAPLGRSWSVMNASLEGAITSTMALPMAATS